MHRAAEILDYLHANGHLPAPSVTRFAGGVSGETYLVENSPARVVVKYALERLLVDAEWTAKPERAMTEAAAITLLHELTPGCTPQLYDADSEHNAIVMTAAPPEWLPWKSVLLGEEPDPTEGLSSTAGRLGEILGIWHCRTWHDPAIAAQFDDYEAFEQLRLMPFHRTVAERHPAVALRVTQCADELMSRRDCLVHGDFSPKNVLVGSDGLMVLDFEVAHVGAAVFDVAFLQCHLILKALHLPDSAAELADAASAFVGTYRAAISTQPTSVGALNLLASHTACLLLARVDGLSPAAYLRASTANTVRSIALDVLSDSEPSVSELWSRVLERNG